MYQLIIVDDEALIREGMCKHIPWNDMGFKIAAVFEDGSEAIEYLQNHEVDVVLTDIRMVQVSGLELAEFIYRHKSLTKVVIISGYQEFDYARKAIEFNVKHYLLKPTDEEEIDRVFSQIKNMLDLEHGSNIKAQHNGNAYIKANIHELLDEKTYRCIREKYKQLAAKVNSGLGEEAEIVYNDFFDMCTKMRQELCKTVFIDLFSVLADKLEPLGLNLKQVSEGRYDENVILGINNIPELKQLGIEIIRRAVGFAMQKNEDSSRRIITLACEYIGKYYSRDISLEDVANHVFLSPGYFSRFFKQHTGKTFSDYLINIRVNNAIKLLQDRKHRIYEISFLVGYSSSQYFNRQFKQVLGYTPKDYCRVVLKDGRTDDE